MTEIKTWLGYAWGESDLPCASFLRSREAVQRFLVEFWHGESGSETEDAMRDFDDHDFSLGALKWHFDIGGVSLERVAEIDAGAKLAGAIKKWEARLCESGVRGDNAIVALVLAMKAEIDELRAKLEALEGANRSLPPLPTAQPVKPAPLVPMTMTQDEINTLWDKLKQPLGSGWLPVYEFARAIETFHSIGAKP